MPNKIFQKLITHYLPDYCEGNAPLFVRQLIKLSAARDPIVRDEIEALRSVKTGLQNIPVHSPSKAVLSTLQTQINNISQESPQQLQPNSIYAWGAGMLMALISLVIFIQTIPPGILLQWSIEGEPLEGFQVYRAIEGSEEFELMREIDFRTDSNQYTFLDPLSLPGQQYVYRIDGLGSEGQTIVRESLVANGQDAVMGQLALIATFLLIFYGFIVLARTQFHTPLYLTQLSL